MGSVAENRAYYARYDWRHGGSEWSAYWGSTRAMWTRSLLPRIKPYLPAARAVEIGAGHGRIAQYLLQHVSERLYLFDIMDSCVSTCNKAFSKDPRVVGKKTDGLSLPGVPDQSIDFVISFYSLVHADGATIDAYAAEFDRVLTRNGAVFLHHSNAGAYFDSATAGADKRMRLLALYRDVSVSARRVRAIADAHNLLCAYQECVSWDVNKALTDCFSIIVRKSSARQRHPEPILNPEFWYEMRSTRRVRSLR